MKLTLSGDLVNEGGRQMKTVRLSKAVRVVNISLFIIALAFKGVVDGLVINNDPNSPLNLAKYIVLIICILVYSYEIHLGYRSSGHSIFVHEFQTLMVMMVGIVMISTARSVIASEFTIATVKEYAYWGIPILFSFCAVNIFSLQDLQFCAKAAVVILGISYIVQIGFDTFSFNNIMEAITHITLSGGNNSSSTSAFESNSFPDVFMSLFFFFSYFKKKNYLWLVISLILVILTNKRLMIVFSVIILIAIFLPKPKWKQSHFLFQHLWLIMSTFFLTMPFLVMYSMKEDVEFKILLKTGINMADFWMGRDVMVNNIIQSSFRSFGLGSTFQFQGSLLEVEGVKIYLEIGIVGLALVVFSYWRIVRKDAFCMLMMTYNFININTSTSISTGTFSWIFYLILIGVCLYYKRDYLYTQIT